MRALCLKLRASSSASSPRVLLRFFTRRRKTGGGGWTHAHSPVSWLLCIQRRRRQQQQLCVNACAHGVHRCLTDAQLAGLQPHSPRNEGVRKGISQLFFLPEPSPLFLFFLSYLLSPPRSHTVPPLPASGHSFTASRSARWICTKRQKQIAHSLATAARLPSPHHGCKVLSVCRWEFYSGRSAQPGFCPLFGLLQLQQGKYYVVHRLGFVLRCARWCAVTPSCHTGNLLRK